VSFASSHFVHAQGIEGLHPSRAQGTATCLMPSGVWIRGTHAWMYVRYWNRFMCRHSRILVSCTGQNVSMYGNFGPLVKSTWMCASSSCCSIHEMYQGSTSSSEKKTGIGYSSCSLPCFLKDCGTQLLHFRRLLVSIHTKWKRTLFQEFFLGLHFIPEEVGSTEQMVGFAFFWDWKDAWEEIGGFLGE